MTASVLSVRWRVRGRVQGVAFRWFTRERATAAGIRGWVRNRLDGSVEIRAEGLEDEMAHLRMEVAEGPRFALVKDIEEEILDAEGLGPGFEIRYGED